MNDGAEATTAYNNLTVLLMYSTEYLTKISVKRKGITKRKVNRKLALTPKQLEAKRE